MIIAKYTQIRNTPSMKVVMTSMFFSTKISYDIKELRQGKELREFLGIDKVPKESYTYSLLSKFNLKSFIAMVLRILVWILNYFRKHRKFNLKGKDYKWGDTLLKDSL